MSVHRAPGRIRFRSPLRGPWLTSIFGAVLLAALPLVIITGLLDYVAYGPGQSIPADVGWLHLPVFAWPTRPAWLFRLTQGLHVGLGLALVPVVLAKLWSVIPKLFVWPPIHSAAHALERVSLLLLVGSILFEIATGLLNIQWRSFSGYRTPRSPNCSWESRGGPTDWSISGTCPPDASSAPPGQRHSCAGAGRWLGHLPRPDRGRRPLSRW